MRTLLLVSPGGTAKCFVCSTRMTDVDRHFLVIDGLFAQVDRGVREIAVGLARRCSQVAACFLAMLSVMAISPGDEA